MPAWTTTYQVPKDWPHRRNTIFKRAGRQCEVVTNGVRCDAVATQVDHIIPLAEGGTHDLTNLAAICAGCHKVKSKTERLRGIARQPRERRAPEKHPGLLWGEPSEF
jgi:5-methylcytosine-specific restriction enzyme A